MRTFSSAVLFASLLTTPAFAFDCPFAFGKDITLDFRGDPAKPILMLDPVTVSEVCREGPTTYKLKGMPGVFRTPDSAYSAFKTIQLLKAQGLSAEDLANIHKFVAEKEEHASGRKAQAAK